MLGHQGMQNQGIRRNYEKKPYWNFMQMKENKTFKKPKGNKKVGNLRKQKRRKRM